MTEFFLGVLVGMVAKKIIDDDHLLHRWRNSFQRLRAAYKSRKFNDEWKVGDFFCRYNFDDVECDPDNYDKLMKITDIWDTEFRYIIIEERDRHHQLFGNAPATQSPTPVTKRKHIMKKKYLYQEYSRYRGSNEYTKKSQFAKDLRDVMDEN